MRHLDLFSGIGGFALAAEWVWGEVEHIFCEIDPFCQKVLKKHWPDAPINTDIRTLNNEWIVANTKRERPIQCEHKERTRQEEVLSERCRNPFGIDLLTGGFPCQPFSCAGKRLGNDDHRALWPEMLRVIKEMRPRWVIGENVAGFINMGLDQSIADLELEGYEVQPYIIPACAVNAPHRRDRVWIVAYSENERARRGPEEVRREDGRQDGELLSERSNANSLDTNSADTGIEGLRRERQDSILQNACDSIRSGLSGNSRRRPGQEPEDGLSQCEQSFGNAKSPRLSGGIDGPGEEQYGRAGAGGIEWNKPWLEVATELCGVDDGLPAELDGFKLSKSKHREQRLKALGNAIVPQVVAVIMQAIKEQDLNS